MKICTHIFYLCLFFFSIFQLVCGDCFSEPVTLLAPARPRPETSQETPKASDAASFETDVLISLMDPYLYTNSDMDAPQMFAVFEPLQTDDAVELQRRDLLGDIEEIRYLNKKAWGANVAIRHTGANIFVLESKPWWDEENQKYRQAQVKSIIFNGVSDNGWNLPVGLPLEILPLVRPVGLYSPCLFSGVVLKNGREAAGLPVRIGHINENGLGIATPWHEAMLVLTNGNGEFSAILNEPGWWYCEAATPGEPLKGTDGELKQLEASAVFWLYVDSLITQKRK